jgi:hypothetical protein
MPDPDEYAASYSAMYRHTYYHDVAPTQAQIGHVLQLADAYLYLVNCPITQAVGKLRDIRRARVAALTKLEEST